MLSRDRISRCVAIVSGLVVFVGFTAMAHAGCPDLCTGTATEPVMVPPLDCLSIRTYVSDCGCESNFDVVSSCDTDVEAVGFTFIGCLPVGSSDTESFVFDGSTIYPNYSCRKGEKITGVGKIAYEYHFVKDGTDYKLTYESDVTSFDDSGCACEVVGRPVSPVSAAVFGIALVLATRRRMSCNANRP